MLHLRKLISPFLSTSHLPALSQTSPILPLYRLLATTASIPPEPFPVEDYLVTACGLTRPKAHKASKKLSHFRSPSRIDAVLAFLSALGISRSGIASVVAADPQLLCADVENNLAKRVVELTDLGLTRPQIARLIPLARVSFRTSSLASNLAFWLPVFGSFENILKVIKANSGLLATDLEKVAKPNLALLQQCGINVREDFSAYIIRVLTRHPVHVQNALLNIEKLGVPRNSPMFRYALMSFAAQSKERLANKMGILEMLGWSQDDVLIAVRKMPGILAMSEERLRKNVNFLISDAGLEIPYIARRPVLVMYSHEGRVLPRHSLLKILNARGLLDAKTDFYTIAAMTEKKFLDKFVHPYKDSIPGLAVSFASTCAGKVPNGVDT
jgi:mTERF domain-containing protein